MITNLETDTHMHPLVSWRSVVAGLFVTMLSMAILLSLGMAFGGLSLEDGAAAGNVGAFTGIWFIVSALISLFTGSYFAARISKFQTPRIGSAQAVVISALFFGFFLYQMMSAVGWAGRTAVSAVSTTASVAASGVGEAAQSPMMNDMIEDALGDLNIQRSEVKTVVTGVASRLVRGNTEGAKNYLARHAGITPAEADRRIAALKTQTDQALTQAREATARGLQAAGWTLFVTLILGTLAACVGGGLGSRTNLRKPLVREHAVESAELAFR